MPNRSADRYRLWLAEGNAPPRVPDFDLLTRQEVQDWIRAMPSGNVTQLARHSFPGEPPLYLSSFRILLSIAHHKRMGKSFESLYRRLPFWFQWRRQFPVEACVRQDARFRKTPKRDNPLNLLKGTK